MAADKLLSIYLNDHLAGATIGVELAQAHPQRHRPGHASRSDEPDPHRGKTSWEASGERIMT
jgi:hypothetical protein